MTNIKALHFGSPLLIRNLALIGLLVVAVAVSPKRAHADGVETAAAIMIGAAVLYAAHDSHRDDRHYSKTYQQKSHSHQQVVYRNPGHHQASYNSGYSYNKGYSNQGSYRYENGKSQHHANNNHSDRYARDNHDRQGKQNTKGRAQLNDRQKHNEKYWNTRVKISQRH
ncbi:Uncharacterised protein [Zhongshania aliphaticivorans]|uniref:Uncharacterized protein n=1 Tax=Zhongshania aliphaticivorans TaxID=1470434 RepID=A0A5S9N629_9GAMM|nr:hypothetical protein [Zhongshania aliphaticivorans]CAA0082323.1 Uncharacterised protein [Zhongshania aliphaticivorans]CAA0084398.1 Uncharacterised protein [Zhongshania aliphaticivorans]